MTGGNAAILEYIIIFSIKSKKYLQKSSFFNKIKVRFSIMLRFWDTAIK